MNNLNTPLLLAKGLAKTYGQGTTVVEVLKAVKALKKATAAA